MHISNRVINMEIIFYIHGVHKLPGVYVEQETRNHSSGLYQRAFLTSLESSSISHPCQGSPHCGCLLNVHVSIHAFKSFIKVQWSKLRLRCTEVLWVIHFIVSLILVLV